jgi:hypothetical protein
MKALTVWAAICPKSCLKSLASALSGLFSVFKYRSLLSPDFAFVKPELLKVKASKAISRSLPALMAATRGNRVIALALSSSTFFGKCFAVRTKPTARRTLRVGDDR